MGRDRKLVLFVPPEDACAAFQINSAAVDGLNIQQWLFTIVRAVIAGPLCEGALSL